MRSPIGKVGGRWYSCSMGIGVGNMDVSLRRRLMFGALAGLVAAGFSGMAPARAQAPPNADGLVMPNLSSYATFGYGWNINNLSWDRLKVGSAGLIVQAPSTGFATSTGATTETATAQTVATANTFQTALALSASRKGCRITNKGTDVLLVGISPATTVTSRVLAAGTATSDGGVYDCASLSGTPNSNLIQATSPTLGNAFLVEAW